MAQYGMVIINAAAYNTVISDTQTIPMEKSETNQTRDKVLNQPVNKCKYFD